MGFLIDRNSVISLIIVLMVQSALANNRSINDATSGPRKNVLDNVTSTGQNYCNLNSDFIIGDTSAELGSLPGIGREKAVFASFCIKQGQKWVFNFRYSRSNGWLYDAFALCDGWIAIAEIYNNARTPSAPIVDAEANLGASICGEIRKGVVAKSGDYYNALNQQGLGDSEMIELLRDAYTAAKSDNQKLRSE